MKEILEYFMIIRNSKPITIEQEFEVYMDNLKKKFPNDMDLGKFMRNN